MAKIEKQHSLVAVDRMEGKIAPWLSYMGHVKRLAEELISASATQPSLCQMLKRNSWWTSFMKVNDTSGIYHETSRDNHEKR